MENANSLPSGYEFLNHPADVWVHAWGVTLEKAIEQCVYSLMETMIEEKNIEENIIHEIDLEEGTKGSLLVGFLSEFLYLFDVEGFIFISIQIDPIVHTETGKWKIHAVCKGEVYNPLKHVPDIEVKAITYSYLEINEKEERTDIKIVYDI